MQTIVSWIGPLFLTISTVLCLCYAKWRLAGAMFLISAICGGWVMYYPSWFWVVPGIIGYMVIIGVMMIYDKSSASIVDLDELVDLGEDS